MEVFPAKIVESLLWNRAALEAVLNRLPAERRAAPIVCSSSQQRRTAAQPLPARWAECGDGGMLTEDTGEAAESATTAGRAWPIHDDLAVEEAIHVAGTQRR
jgi:hypothetical protein